MKTKIVIIPVYQKYWLYHVWSVTTASEMERAVPWTQGSTLQEKAALLGKEVSHRMNSAVHRQWKSLQAADEGTFKNRLYRLGQWVLSKEDPNETFLKSIPRGARELEVIHPASMEERLVRRRLRRMATAQEAFHNRRILGWALATLPQLPLVLTPLPNVTVYFTAYKMVSHFQAVQGCRTLRSAFEQYDAKERERAHATASAAAAAAASSANGEAGSGGGGWGLRRLLPWPRRRRQAGQGDKEARTAAAAGAAEALYSELAGPDRAASGAALAPAPRFLASRTLDSVVQPLERWMAPLSDEMAVRVRDLLRLSSSSPSWHHSQTQPHSNFHGGRPEATSSGTNTAATRTPTGAAAVAGQPPAPEPQAKTAPSNGASVGRKGGREAGAGPGYANATTGASASTGAGDRGHSSRNSRTTDPGVSEGGETPQPDGLDSLPDLVARMRTQVLEREQQKQQGSSSGCR